MCGHFRSLSQQRLEHAVIEEEFQEVVGKKPVADGLAPDLRWHHS